MITLEYCEDGEPVSDFNYRHWLEKFTLTIRAGLDIDANYKVSTSLPIIAVRHEIAKGEIDHQKIIFKFGEHHLRSNEYGVMDNWPEGYCDIDLDLCSKILRLGAKKRKEKKLHMEEENASNLQSETWVPHG